jgi:hypothetical protein
VTVTPSPIAIVTAALGSGLMPGSAWIAHIARAVPDSVHFIAGNVDGQSADDNRVRLLHLGGSKDLTPMFARFCGALCAFNRGHETVAFLDPPHLPSSTHLDRCRELLRTHRAGAVISGVFSAVDGQAANAPTPLAQPGESASGWVLHARAAHLISAWGLLPPAVGVFEGRFMYHWARRAGVPVAVNPEPGLFAPDEPSADHGVLRAGAPPDATPDLFQQRLGVRINLT